LTYKIIDFAEAPVDEAELDWVVDETLLEAPTWPRGDVEIRRYPTIATTTIPPTK